MCGDCQIAYLACRQTCWHNTASHKRSLDSELTINWKRKPGMFNIHVIGKMIFSFSFFIYFINIVRRNKDFNRKSGDDNYVIVHHCNSVRWTLYNKPIFYNNWHKDYWFIHAMEYLLSHKCNILKHCWWISFIAIFCVSHTNCVSPNDHNIRGRKL